jgi:hypothetical protein
LIEISVEYFIRGGIIQTLARLNGIVEVKLPPAKPEAYWVSASKAP